MCDNGKRAVTILIAEDDEDDYLLISETLLDYRVTNKINWVKDGEELMDYLLQRGHYAPEEATATRPALILLDLNMPRKDGREALKEIKSHPQLRRIPVVILTTSQSDEDIVRSYDLGVNSYIRKPMRFQDFVEQVKELGRYWFEMVELPVEP